MRKRVDFAAIDAAAVTLLPVLAARWCPGGRQHGAEYTALNPTRADTRLGSFKINVRSGAWADFSTGDRGRGAISLASYVHNLKPLEAARLLANMLGVNQ